MSNQGPHTGGGDIGGCDRDALAGGGVSHATAFGSILFPSGIESTLRQRSQEPACFVDLNLDQVIAAVVARRDEDFLRPIFYSPCRSEQVVRYRQAVFADLENPQVFRLFPAFCEAMRAVHADIAYAKKISEKRHRHTVVLRAVGSYCEAVARLLGGLDTQPLRSMGLVSLRDYLAAYIGSDAFTRLASEAQNLRETLSMINYSLLFRGDRVIVRKYAREPDYAATILERFAKFREANAAGAAPARSADAFSLNHIEEGILEFVGRSP